MAEALATERGPKGAAEDREVNHPLNIILPPDGLNLDGQPRRAVRHQYRAALGAGRPAPRSGTTASVQAGPTSLATTPRRAGEWTTMTLKSPHTAVLLIGASRGLGLAMAEEYLNSGSQVVATVPGAQRTELHDAQHGRGGLQFLDYRGETVAW